MVFNLQVFFSKESKRDHSILYKSQIKYRSADIVATEMSCINRVQNSLRGRIGYDVFFFQNSPHLSNLRNILSFSLLGSLNNSMSVSGKVCHVTSTWLNQPRSLRIWRMFLSVFFLQESVISFYRQRAIPYLSVIFS